MTKHENKPRDGSQDRNGWKATRKLARRAKAAKRGEFITKSLDRAIYFGKETK